MSKRLLPGASRFSVTNFSDFKRVKLTLQLNVVNRVFPPEERWQMYPLEVCGDLAV